VEAAVVAGEDDGPATSGDGDAVVFMDFRADRARQLTRAFIEPDFDGFDRGRVPKLAAFVTLTQYHRDFDCPAAFPPQRLDNVLGEVLAGHGLRQLRLAETEKYAHVTFFFNGGREQPFDGEERQLIPSPKVATYDLQPEMSAEEMTDALVSAIQGGGFEVIICNYANPDMVGHTGDFDAAVQAVECVDRCLGRAVEAIETAGGALLVTADHGNVEKMSDPETGQAHTAHTDTPVPLVCAGLAGISLADGGALRDIAPTMLALLQLPVPDEMTGRSLLQAEAGASRKAVP
jgi:2,3-bisphosphoglycerate-independent phosphoglycerate mutase